MNTKFDIAIVGQGIAGTLMAWNLQKTGKKVLIIDDHHYGSSSIVAAGIVNPITGKNYVTSWRILDFLPVAKETYDELNCHFGFQCYSNANIIRSLYSISDENTWLAKSSDPGLSQFICRDVDLDGYAGKVNKPFSYGELQGTFYVNMALIMAAIKNEWVTNNSYVEERFQYSKLNTIANGFTYFGMSFKEIVFCEGHQAINNPFFSKSGLAPSKGEVLLVKIPEAGFTKMYKDGIFIVPQGDDLYWVGSGYEWNAMDDKPTKKNYDVLSRELSRVLKVPYEIVDHKAAIRPTMQNRRPLLTVHHTLAGMYMFNGLGTKGASIGPFVAKQFSRYISEKNATDLILT